MVFLVASLWIELRVITSTQRGAVRTKMASDPENYLPNITEFQLRSAADACPVHDTRPPIHLACLYDTLCRSAWWKCLTSVG